MKQTINYSLFKPKSLLFLFGFLVLFISCNSNEDDEPLSDVNRVSMKTLPQVNYVIGSTLNLSNMVITLDKGGKNIDIPFASFAQEDITTEPKNGKVLDFSDVSVIVKLGASGKGLIQPISVTNNVTEIDIKTEPTKKYLQGQKLDLSEMVLTFTYENGDVKDFTYSEIQKEIVTVPANGNELSTDDEKVTITHISTGVNVQQDLNIIRFIPIRGELITSPTKTEYKVGEKLDLSGIVIRYTLLDRSEVDVVGFDDYKALRLTAKPSNNEVLKASDKRVTVKHVTGVSVRISITVTP